MLGFHYDSEQLEARLFNVSNLLGFHYAFQELGVRLFNVPYLVGFHYSFDEMEDSRVFNTPVQPI
jgi:hypothetical protein